METNNGAKTVGGMTFAEYFGAGKPFFKTERNDDATNKSAVVL
jgi:hypothetical protein